MDYCYPKTSIKRVKELIALLEPYSTAWSEWIESGACFLSQREIIIIQNYLLTGSHFKSGSEFNISIITAASILNKSKLQLSWNYGKFLGWLTERLLERHGIITYESELDRFLNSPLIFVLIPWQLKVKLGYLCESTIGDILTKYSEDKIKRFWFLDKKSFKEFKTVLQQNNCLHLLR